MVFPVFPKLGVFIAEQLSRKGVGKKRTGNRGLAKAPSESGAVGDICMNIKSSCTAICDFASDIKRGQQEQFSSSPSSKFFGVSGIEWVWNGHWVGGGAIMRPGQRLISG